MKRLLATGVCMLFGLSLVAGCNGSGLQPFQPPSANQNAPVSNGTAASQLHQVVAGGEQFAHPTNYTVTDLGTLGGTFSLAIGVNDAGVVSGNSNLPGDKAQHAFLWEKGLMRDLGTFGGPNSGTFFDLNDSNEVAGIADTSTPDPLGEDYCGFGTHLICRAFLWRHGVMTALPTLGGNNDYGAEINNRGQVGGSAENTTLDQTCAASAFQSKPVLWQNGQVKELPTFNHDPDGGAPVVNDEGQVAGTSGDCSIIARHAWFWQDGTLTGIGGLGGTTTTTEDMNNQGQVVGYAYLKGDTVAHAYLWQHGVIIDLGTLPGDVVSAAYGINSEGQVVGESDDVSGNQRAILWQNGVMTDLNTLIPPDSPLFLLVASGELNSRGQIGGLALQKNTGEIHAFLLTPSNNAFRAQSTGGRGATSYGSLRGTGGVRLTQSLRKLLLRGYGHGMPKFLTSNH